MRPRRGTHQSSVLSEISSQFQDECSAAPGRFFIDRWGESASARRNIVFGPTTLTTGCSPIVLVTTPPQPASNARRMFDSDSVGGADESRNGFRKRTPVNVVDKSAAMISSGGPEGPPYPWSAARLVPRSANGCFNYTVRLVGGDEYLVRIVQPERLQVDKQMMPVRHRQRDLLGVCTGRQRGLRHRVQRVLDRAALVHRKYLEQGRADPFANRKLGRARAIFPRRRDRRRENAIVGF